MGTLFYDVVMVAHPMHSETIEAPQRPQRTHNHYVALKQRPQRTKKSHMTTEFNDVVKTGIDYTRMLIFKVTKRKQRFNAHVQSENRLLAPLYICVGI